MVMARGGRLRSPESAAEGVNRAACGLKGADRIFEIGAVVAPTGDRSVICVKLAHPPPDCASLRSDEAEAESREAQDDRGIEQFVGKVLRQRRIVHVLSLPHGPAAGRHAGLLLVVSARVFARLHGHPVQRPGSTGPRHHKPCRDGSDQRAEAGQQNVVDGGDAEREHVLRGLDHD